MEKAIYVLIGGGIGASARYGLSLFMGKFSSSEFPWPTIAVNSIGCFMIGIFWYVFDQADLPLNLKLFLTTGLLGGFTTFSAFALESFVLFRGGETGMAVLNILLSNVSGIFLVFGGYYLSKVVAGVIS